MKVSQSTLVVRESLMIKNTKNCYENDRLHAINAEIMTLNLLNFLIKLKRIK